MHRNVWAFAFAVVGVLAASAGAIENDRVTSRESQYLLGVHNWHPLEGEQLTQAAFNPTDPTQLWEPVLGDPMRSTYGRLVDRGWLVHSALATEYAQGHNLVIKRAYDQGMTNIIRINYRFYLHEQSQTMVHETVPLTNRHDDLEEFCNQVRTMLTKQVWDGVDTAYRIPDYAHIYIIGNEMNLWNECGGYPNGDISPQWYATVFERVSRVIHSVQSNAKVLAAMPGTWSGAGAPPDGAAYEWQSYWQAELNALAVSTVKPWVGGFAIHTYGYHDCNQPHPRYDSTTSGFRTYQTIIADADARGFGGHPIYITETNTVLDCGLPYDVLPIDPYSGIRGHWYQLALSEVGAWNDAQLQHRIKCLAWFQWYDKTRSFDWCQMLWPDGRAPINGMNQAQADYGHTIRDLNYNYPGPEILKNTTVRMDGTVRSYYSGDALPYAVVWTNKGNYRCVADAQGYYQLSLVAGRSYDVYVDWGGRSLPVGTHYVDTYRYQYLDVPIELPGGVRGNVQAAGGYPVEAGRVAMLGSITAVSDRVQPNASYRVGGVTTDTVRVWASLPGYQTAAFSGVSITPGSITNLNVALNPVSNNYCWNGGFENGNLSGWSTFGETLDGVRMGPWYDSIVPVGGSYFFGAAINTPNTQGYANDFEIGGIRRQLSSVPIGSQIIASCLVITQRHDADGNPDGLPLDSAVRIGIHPAGSLDENSTGIVWSDWHQSDRAWTPLYSPPVTVTSSTPSLFVHFRLYNQCYYLRNCDVNAEPCAEWKIAAVDDVCVVPATSPTVQGTVLAYGSPLSQATVTLSSYDGEYRQVCTTSANGAYTCNNVVPGGYRLTFYRQAYHPVEVDLGYMGPGEVRQNLNLDANLVQTTVLNSISTSTPTPTGVTIYWSTPFETDSVVEYGPTAAYGKVKVVSDLVYGHSVALTGLSPGTTYHYRVSSVREGFVPGVSSDRTFTTPLPSITISNIYVDNITQTSARVRWTTNVASSSRVDYGTTTSYGSYAYDGTQVTSHAITLNGLSPGVTYHYKVTSTRSGYQTGVSSDNTFTTPLPPIVLYDEMQTITTHNSFTVTWMTSPASTSRVYYRVSGTSTWSSVYSASLVSTHVMTVSGLLANTTYQYYVKSTRSGYQDATSSIRTFTTAAGGSTGTLTGTVTFNDLYGGWMQPGGGEELTQNRIDKPLKRIGAGATAEGHDRYAARVPPDDGIPEIGPLPGATVTVAGLSAESDWDGSYTILGIPAGTYTATCYHPARGTLTGTVTITANGTTYKSWEYRGSVW